MNFIKKWYTYQKERFPILMYGLYVFSIVIGTFFISNEICENSYQNLFKNNYQGDLLNYAMTRASTFYYKLENSYSNVYSGYFAIFNGKNY